MAGDSLPSQTGGPEELGILEFLEHARQESEQSLQNLKFYVSRCQQALEVFGSQLQTQTLSHLASIDVLVEKLRRRVATPDCVVVEGHRKSSQDGKTDVECVGMPNLTPLAIAHFKRASAQAIFPGAKLKGRVTPQVTGTIVPPKPLMSGAPRGVCLASSRGKSDPLLRNLLAANKYTPLASNLDFAAGNINDAEIYKLLTTGSWKKTLEVAKAAKNSDPIMTSQFATVQSERKRGTGVLMSTTSTTASSGHELPAGDETGVAASETRPDIAAANDDLQAIEADVVAATGIPCFRDLLRQSVMEDLENEPFRDSGDGDRTYADRLANSVFDNALSMSETACQQENRKPSYPKFDSTEGDTCITDSDTIGGEMSANSCIIKSPRPPQLTNSIKGRPEPLVRGLMTTELLKRAYLLGRDDYLFFEWMSPSENYESPSLFPHGAFRAEILFNTMNITEPPFYIGEGGEGSLRDGVEGPPDEGEGDGDSAKTLSHRTGSSRLDPLCAQLIFEVQTRPLEQCTREACCKAFRQLMDWAEERVTVLKLPSPMTAAMKTSMGGDGDSGPNGANQRASEIEEWDGNFATLNCHPLPQDYGRSELFDKRGSMRYIQLAATNPPVPPSMQEIRRKARNFNAWYTVQYGNGMWKAEVIVDQLNSKRNSFQRSLKQMTYQNAQLQVMRWLFKKCKDLNIATFRYKGRKDEYLVAVPITSSHNSYQTDNIGYTLLECPEKRKKPEETTGGEERVDATDILKRRRQ